MSEILVDSLKTKMISSIIKSKEYTELIKKLTSDIISNSKTAENEATVVSGFEIQLYGFVDNILGLKILPTKEKHVGTERHIAKGRIDSKVGALIIEFKHSSALKTESQQKKATEQLISYLKGLNSEDGINYKGLITDGIVIKFVSIQDGLIKEEPFQSLTYRAMDRIIRDIVLLEQKALTPQNLVKDFYNSEDDSIALELVHNLYESLKDPSVKTMQLFEEWKELFRLAHDDKSKQQAIEDRRDALSKIIGHKVHDNTDEYKILYALQTSYAIIIKLVAFNVLSKIKFNINLLDYNRLSGMDSETLRSKISEIEDGGIFRDLGMWNIFEGDFFSWYCEEEQWSEEISSDIKKIFHLLSRYEDKSLFPSSNTVTDLFRDLYMKIIPDKVRHSLGEFYTPSWLADSVVSEGISNLSSNYDWRGLDPCAGSGTFVVTMIRKVLAETLYLSKSEQLANVLKRVKGVDLNPLAVLTSKINYFINISHLIEDINEIEIPIYLGDASYNPQKVNIEEIECLNYTVSTPSGDISILLPSTIIDDTIPFNDLMREVELFVMEENYEDAFNLFLKNIPEINGSPVILDSLSTMLRKLIELEQQGWNGIWVRVVRNFLCTVALGKFDIIVGNPPWIDWKSLPEGYRERIKSLCISRELFSGDKRTGGINLNICALITNVVSQRWLSDQGILAFLMPQTLVFQQSYEGFRKLKLEDGSRLYFQGFIDWTKSGHPFKPVTEKFLTYLISRKFVDYSKGVPTTIYKLKPKKSLLNYLQIESFTEVEEIFVKEHLLLGQTNPNNTKFTYAKGESELKNFNLISGECSYIGREGIEFYPQELFLLQVDKDVSTAAIEGVEFFKNYQNKKSKHNVPPQTVPLEKIFLHPLIKGTNIGRFKISELEYIVPFPYDSSNPKVPLNFSELNQQSRFLASYFRRNQNVLEKQTDYSNKIIGDEGAPYYALARVGKYSYATYHVAFRDNSKWVATVTKPIDTEWGGVRRPLFQNHAVSICEDLNGDFISEDEAHYVCAIFNAPIVQKFILNTSDSRSFKIRPEIKVPKYDNHNELHLQLSQLSKEAHLLASEGEDLALIDEKLDELYLELCKK